MAALASNDETERYLSALLHCWDVAIIKVRARLLAHDDAMCREYLRCSDLAAEDLCFTLLPRSRTLVLMRSPAERTACFEGPYIVLRMMGAHNTAVELMDKDGGTRVVPIVNVKPFVAGNRLKTRS